MISCISTLGCPEKSLGETMILADSWGVQQLELRALSGGLDLPAALNGEFGTPARFRQAVDQQGMKVAAFDASLRFTDAPHPGRRAEIEQLLPWAEALSGTLIRAFDGRTGISELGLANAADNLDWWERLKSEHGLHSELIVETHDSLLRADALARFSEKFPTMRILWDAHHTWREGGSTLAEVWQVLVSRVAHIHVKDSQLDPTQPEGYRYVLPGDGNFPMENLRALVAGGEYAGAVSLEWEKYWHPDLPPASVAIAAARRCGWMQPGGT